MIEVEKPASAKGDSDSDDSVSDELNQDQLMDINQSMKAKRSGRNVRMSAQMESTYKEALMNVIFGQFTQANQKLKHLITTNPENPEPYHLMGTMYEETNDLKKAVEYYFISTYLAPPNFEKWVKVADMSMELKMFSQAAYCYGRALKIDNYNIDLSIKRAEAFELCGQDRKAITMYKRILKLTKSLPTIKRYAKLRFKRGQFDKARQILLNSEILNQGEQEILDQNVLYMVCETYLKEMKYEQLLDFMLQKVLKPKQGQRNQNQNKLQVQNGYHNEEHNQKEQKVQYDIQNTPVEFIRLLYICILANSKQKTRGVSLQQVQQIFYEAYESQDAEQYEEVAKHLFKINEDKASKLIEWLLGLNNAKHKSVDNYLLVSEYLKKKGQIQKAEDIISKGIAKHPQSAQLQIQMTHFKVLLGKNCSENRNQNGRPGKSRRNIRKNANKEAEEAIFEQSQQQDLFPDLSSSNFEMEQIPDKKQGQEQFDSEMFADNPRKGNSKAFERKPQKKTQVMRAKKHMKTNDQEIVQKVLENTRLTMSKILESLELQTNGRIQQSVQNQDQSIPQYSIKYYKDVFKSIELIAELTSNFQNENGETNIEYNQVGNSSIMNNKNHIKRRSPATGFKFFSQQSAGFQSKLSLRNVQANKFINQNIEAIGEIIQKAIQFQYFLLKEKHYKKVIGLAQELARSHVLRRNLRNHLLIKTKIKVYQVAVLACLQIKKYGKALFFMRYLINREPENILYVLLLGFFARNSPKKNCLGSMFRKFIASKPKEGEQLFRYLLALQHLETSQYEILLNLFAGILSNQTNLSLQERSKMYLICSACLIQTASSRNTFNKLDQVNRSAFFMRKYVDVMTEIDIKKQASEKNNKVQQNPYVLFNLGRWYSQIKIYQKAIECYTKVTSSEISVKSDKQAQDPSLTILKKKAALNLMIIFKEMEMHEKVQQLSYKWFTIQEQEKD